MIKARRKEVHLCAVLLVGVISYANPHNLRLNDALHNRPFHNEAELLNDMQFH